MYSVIRSTYHILCSVVAYSDLQYYTGCNYPGTHTLFQFVRATAYMLQRVGLYATAIPSVCLSVCSSVTRVICINQNG